MTDELVPASEELTKSDVYQPTPHMIVWLDTAIQLMTDSVSDISEACKISRTAWYDWLKDDNFRKWFKETWDKKLAGESWKLDAIGFKNAKRDHRYWQDMQKRVGNLVDKPTTLQQYNVQGAMSLEFTDKSD